MLSVIMYHFVRDTGYGGHIKALKPTEFKRQLDFFYAKFTFISSHQLEEALIYGKKLPENSVLLTFDDGCIDCYENVFPLLKQRNISAVFAVPGQIVAERKVLDVNKIHFILASSSSLKTYIFNRLDYYRGREFILPDNEELYNEYARANRFDDADTVFVKRVLQVGLQKELRSKITDELFREFVTTNEALFAENLYLSSAQISEMHDYGMTFALHGYEHHWFDRLDEEEYSKDILKALDVFDGIIDKDRWAFVYPYGAVTREVIDFSKNNGCFCGFTVEARAADISADSRFLLPRYDTNDFPPKSSNYIKAGAL